MEKVIFISNCNYIIEGLFDMNTYIAYYMCMQKVELSHS